MKNFWPYLLVAVCLANPVNATHLVGGDIYYECLGNGNFRLTLKVYRDCLNGQAPFDGPASIGIFNSSGGLVQNVLVPFDGSQNVPLVVNNPCLQVPPNLCVDYAEYTTEVNLPFLAGGYHVAYQRCCRNGTIVNLADPGAQGNTNYVHITEQALTACNSSPRFNAFPPVAICINDLLVFNHAATDPDGDQLVYSLCTPLHGASEALPMPSPPAAPPYANVQWLNPYSDQYPMASNPPLSIDPVTGVLSGTPTQLGQYVVGVCVQEFRNGVLLSTIRRDFQFNVVNCSSNVQALIPAQATYHNPCDGLTVDFGNGSINSTFYHWDFGVTSSISDTSDLQFPTFTFPDSGTYAVMLVANPGYPCADTTYSNISVQFPVIAQIPYSGDACFDSNSFDFVAGGSYTGNATFNWNFGPTAIPATSNQQNPQDVRFSVPGSNLISVTITVGNCTDTESATITTYERPLARIKPGPWQGCAPLFVQFRDSSTAATPLFYYWQFGDGATSNNPMPWHSYQRPGFYTVTSTIWTTSGCIDTITVVLDSAVVVLERPYGKAQVEPRSASIFDPNFSFSLTEPDSTLTTCAFYTGDGTLLTGHFPNCDFNYAYRDTGNYAAYYLIANASGCTDTIRVNLRVEPEFRFWLPNAFTPNNDGLNDTFGPVFMGIREFDFKIFDRWGQEVFTTTDAGKMWDGTVNGGNLIAPGGVYAWRIVMRNVFGKQFKTDGKVVLVR